MRSTCYVPEIGDTPDVGVGPLGPRVVVRNEYRASRLASRAGAWKLRGGGWEYNYPQMLLRIR